MSIIFSPDSLRQQVEAATGGHVTVLYDDKGYPSYMRVIPKFRYQDLGFSSELGTGVATAFLVNSQEKSEIFIGQYLASTHDGRAVALPGKDPRAGIDYDDAKAACVDKGPGWHLMTRHEWAAVALWCMANGFQPRGNTDYGRAHDATHETAMRPDGLAPGVTTGNGRTATGGGPASWRHDGGITGIADLVGNVREWCDGLKLINGRVHCTQDNHFTQDEGDWSALDHYVSNESGNTPTLKNSAGVSNSTFINSTWGSLAKDAGYTESQLLQRLLFSPAGIIPQGGFYVRTAGERIPFCGGSRESGSNAGLAALYLNHVRSVTFSYIGFRPAFVS